MSEFEELSTQVPGIEDRHLERIFYNGLSTEMKEVTKMKDPQGLPNFIAAVLRMEKSAFCRVVSKVAPVEVGGTTRTTNINRGACYNNGGKVWEKQRSEASGGKENGGDQQSVQRPRLKYTDAELDAMRRDQICCKCKAPRSRTHICPNREIRVMTVVHGIEMEVMEEDDVILQEMDHNVCCEVRTLFMDSFLGIDSPKTTKLRGRIGQRELIFMIDSGASHNFISPEVASKLRLGMVDSSGVDVLLGNGVMLKVARLCTGVKFQLNTTTFSSKFIALELGSVDVILGVKWLATLGKCEVDWRLQEFSLVYEGVQVTLYGDPTLHCKKLSLKSLSPVYHDPFESTDVLLMSAIVPPVTTGLEPRIAALLSSFEDIFAIPTALPPLRGHDHAINLTSGVSAISVHPYRYLHARKVVMEKMVQEMLEAGIIRPSVSPFSSHVLLVKKKDGGFRFCVDYRALKKSNIPDKYPIPVIDQLLDELHGAVIFSKLGLRSGYHQIRMVEDDIKKTVFQTVEGHYEFLVMSFGLTNVPATFQALINKIFKPFLRDFVLIFFDDILVYSSSLEAHEEHLRKVLQVLREQSLFANPKKCSFGVTQVEYLGHIISKEGVVTDAAKTEAMVKWPTPKTVKQLRRFLGLTGYYWKFVKSHGVMARPLTSLTKTDQFAWSFEAQKSFDTLKSAMVNAPVLTLQDFQKRFVVETDASGVGLGDVLMQDNKPVAYFSYALTEREQLKPAYERELMAVVMAVRKWKNYLLGETFHGSY